MAFNVRFTSLAVLISGMALLTGCRSTQPEPEQEILVKLEWGSLEREDFAVKGEVLVSGGIVEEALAYVFETDESDYLNSRTLEFSSETGEFLTDGMLLRLKVSEQSELLFQSTLGRISLKPLGLDVDVSQFLQLDSSHYIDVARITPAEWELARSYNSRPTTRNDNMPRPAYEASVLSLRYDSDSSQDQIYQNSVERFEDDPFYQNAETLRRGVNNQLYLTIPSVQATGETFDITLAAFDINGHLVSDFAGTVLLQQEGTGEIALPQTVRFQSGEPSIVTLPMAGMALVPGEVRVSVQDQSGRFSANGIPVIIEDDPIDRIFWGDIHTHSNLSDGDFGDIGPDDVYRFGRDVARLDFQALTDHDYRRPIPDWKWPYIEQLAAEFYDPGKFVTLLAYEWSAEDIRFSDVIGHKNVYFRGATAPVYTAFNPLYNTPEKLWSALRTDPGVGEVITIPHHPVRKTELTAEDPWYGGAGTDWRYHDEELQPLVEVYSRWGISETNDSDNPRPVRNSTSTGSAQYALGLGYKLGFIASGDIHDGTPGVSVLPARWSINAYPTGLVAVMAPVLEREAVFDALSLRRCYATSGGRRMLLFFETDDGIQPGETGQISETPVFTVHVLGTTGVKEVSVTRVDGNAHQTIFRSGSLPWNTTLTIADPDFAGDAAYYLKVVQEDNELGWLGPIFLEQRDAALP